MKLCEYLDMLGHRNHAKTGEHQHPAQALLDNDKVPTKMKYVANLPVSVLKWWF